MEELEETSGYIAAGWVEIEGRGGTRFGKMEEEREGEEG